MDATLKDNQGSAYFRPEPTIDRELTEVGRGTPGGELLRRYWHPIALSEEVGDLPLQVKVLGEELILFRTADGRPGLVHPRCIHRGTSLFYGKVEDRGIRCCYHGWLFDPEGRCLEQPCEPGGGVARENFRQPWHPVEELYGMVFAYLGPPAEQPALPRYDVLETVAEDEVIVANGDTIGSGGPPLMHCNWVQTFENIMDPFHVFILHATFSTNQFNDLMAIRPDISWDMLPTGMQAVQIRNLGDGTALRRVVELVQPNVRIVPDPRLSAQGRADNVAWTLPIDDHTTRIFSAFRMKKGTEGALKQFSHGKIYDGKSWFELDEQGHQRFPADYEAQVSQGAITFHSEEHLVTSDRGVSLFRRQFRAAIAAVAEGEAPINAAPEPVLHRVRAGNYIVPLEQAREPVEAP